MKVLIAGGGIGGVTAALCLVDAGLDVEIYERSPAPAEVGAGIQISPNGIKVLERLGLGEALDRIAFRPEALEMRVGMSGFQLFAIPMRDEAVRRYGAPYLHVHRADLMNVLSAALRERAPKAVRLNKDLTSFVQSNGGVDAAFADGTRAAGDVLVGADGIHSRVRDHLNGAMPARFTGNVAWRLVVPASSLAKGLVPPTACIWVGPGRHAVTYYLRRGELVNFVGVVERDGWQKESWTERGDKAELGDDFAGWSKPIAAIIEQAGECYRWALFDRDPLPRWRDGRVTLLGDACHPMLPFVAQGAVMAIEDAWVLSRRLKTAIDIPSALAAYEAARKPRASRVQRAARKRAGLYHKRGTISQLTSYGPMWLAARLAPGVVHASQDWLYSHDVVG
jgi:2-polyprenyl-6-methoxyphenol hydroxylase-like FAD-dependent oxidoreductase